MYTCEYVYMYTYIYIYIYTHHVFMYTHIYIYGYKHVHIGSFERCTLSNREFQLRCCVLSLSLALLLSPPVHACVHRHKPLAVYVYHTDVTYIHSLSLILYTHTCPVSHSLFLSLYVYYTDITKNMCSSYRYNIICVYPHTHSKYTCVIPVMRGREIHTHTQQLHMRIPVMEDLRTSDLDI